MVEIVENGKPYYLKTTFPMKDMQDLHNMMVERSFGQNVRTAEELLKNIPVVTPLDQMLLTESHTKGSFDFNTDTFDKMDTFIWESFFSMMMA